jgi:hypothetical protein
MSNVFNKLDDGDPAIELESILEGMDVPLRRREISKSNLRWLNRNIRIQNGDHPQIQGACDLIVLLLKKDR